MLPGLDDLLSEIELPSNECVLHVTDKSIMGRQVMLQSKTGEVCLVSEDALRSECKLFSENKDEGPSIFSFSPEQPLSLEGNIGAVKAFVLLLRGENKEAWSVCSTTDLLELWQICFFYDCVTALPRVRKELSYRLEDVQKELSPTQDVIPILAQAIKFHDAQLTRSASCQWFRRIAEQPDITPAQLDNVSSAVVAQLLNEARNTIRVLQGEVKSEHVAKMCLHKQVCTLSGMPWKDTLRKRSKKRTTKGKKASRK